MTKIAPRKYKFRGGRIFIGWKGRVYLLHLDFHGLTILLMRRRRRHNAN